MSRTQARAPRRGVNSAGTPPRRREEFARLQNEVKELSEQVKALEVAEQRRFLRELNSHSEGTETSLATNATNVSATSENRSLGLRLLTPEKEPEAAPPLAP
jgi:hypothetical protein